MLKLSDLLRNEKFLAWSVQRKGRKITASASAQKHYTVSQVAQQWGVSADLIRDVFSSEPGVLRFDRPATRNKRAYSTLRIPESVLVRVHTHLSAA